MTDMNKRKAGLLALLLLSAVAILHFLDMWDWIDVSDDVLMISRWAVVPSLAFFAIYKR